MNTESSKYKKLKEIRDELLNLVDSPLYAERVSDRMFPVIGEGNHDADILFVGEAPGKNEAKTGKPFCGMSGRVLDELLQSIKLDREKVYITNIVKDRPTNNRDPKKEEIEIYGPFLDRQIDIIEPKVIVPLGRFAVEYIMKKFELENDLQAIGKIHGEIFDTKINKKDIKIIPLYHPAVAVYNRNMIDILKKDFKLLKKFI